MDTPPPTERAARSRRRQEIKSGIREAVSRPRTLRCSPFPPTIRMSSGQHSPSPSRTGSPFRRRKHPSIRGRGEGKGKGKAPVRAVTPPSSPTARHLIDDPPTPSKPRDPAGERPQGLHVSGLDLEEAPTNLSLPDDPFQADPLQAHHIALTDRGSIAPYRSAPDIPLFNLIADDVDGKLQATVGHTVALVSGEMRSMAAKGVGHTVALVSGEMRSMVAKGVGHTVSALSRDVQESERRIIKTMATIVDQHAHQRPVVDMRTPEALVTLATKMDQLQETLNNTVHRPAPQHPPQRTHDLAKHTRTVLEATHAQTLQQRDHHIAMLEEEIRKRTRDSIETQLERQVQQFRQSGPGLRRFRHASAPSEHHPQRDALIRQAQVGEIEGLGDERQEEERQGGEQKGEEQRNEPLQAGQRLVDEARQGAQAEIKLLKSKLIGGQEANAALWQQIREAERRKTALEQDVRNFKDLSGQWKSFHDDFVRQNAQAQDDVLHNYDDGGGEGGAAVTAGSRKSLLQRHEHATFLSRAQPATVAPQTEPLRRQNQSAVSEHVSSAPGRDPALRNDSDEMVGVVQGASERSGLGTSNTVPGPDTVSRRITGLDRASREKGTEWRGDATGAEYARAPGAWSDEMDPV